MVFHRFLAGEVPGRQLSIAVNGEPIQPWDPFARNEPLTQRLPTQRLPLPREDGGGTVVVTPYILPHQSHFSSPEAHEAAAGPHRWNRQQGLYIYRRHRLVQSGGWSRLRTMDEHSKLARVAVDIPPGGDEAFRINVAKMTVGLPDSIRAELRVLVAGIVSRAQDIYRQRVRLVPDPESGIGDGSGEVGLAIGDHWSLIVEVLERELADHPDVLDRVLLALINAQPGTTQSATMPNAQAATQ
jgi:hypothetical protein